MNQTRTIPAADVLSDLELDDLRELAGELYALRLDILTIVTQRRCETPISDTLAERQRRHMAEIGRLLIALAGEGEGDEALSYTTAEG